MPLYNVEEAGKGRSTGEMDGEKGRGKGAKRARTREEDV